MTELPAADRRACSVTADEPCLPPHTTPEDRRFRRRLFRAHPWMFLLLAASAGALVVSLFGLLR